VVPELGASPDPELCRTLLEKPSKRAVMYLDERFLFGASAVEGEGEAAFPREPSSRARMEGRVSGSTVV